MKKTLTTLLLLSIVLLLSAQKITVIENPYYEVRNSGIEDISKIELTPTQIKLYVHATFVPGWWVKFPKTTFIRPEGKGKIYITDMEQGGIDKEITMPASGETTFVLIFPRPDASVKSFDFGENERTYVFGISLEKDTKKRREEQIKQQQQAETKALAWIEAELAKSKKQPLKNFNSDDFFGQDTARLIGYIKGYNPKIGKNTGIMYVSNELTREDYPLVIEIQPDGRFDLNIPMTYPAMPYIHMLDFINDNLYLEPGCTLAAVLDWEDVLLADRHRDKRDAVKMKFYGPLAEINSDIKATKLETYDWRNLKENIKNNPPAAFKKLATDRYERNKKIIDSKRGILSDKSISLLNNMAFAAYGYLLMDFPSTRTYILKDDTTATAIVNEPLPAGYYDFLKESPLDQSILISRDASPFIIDSNITSNFSRCINW